MLRLLRPLVSRCVSTSPKQVAIRLASTQTQENQFKYRYTRNENNLLSEEQQQFYEENGYVVLRNLIPSDEIDKYEERFNDYASGKIKPDGFLLLMKELSAVKENKIDERTMYKIQELQFDDVLFGYCTHPKLLDYVEAIVGPNIMSISSMLINKPPDSGSKSSRHPLHQDCTYFPIRPDERIVGSWTAMQHIHRENGCLVVVPGSHKIGLLDHEYPEWEGGVNRFYIGIKDKSILDKRLHLDMNKGDTVLFHSLLIHGSGMNRTDGFRKAISCHYAASECHFIEVKGSKHEKIGEEFEQVYKKKLGEDSGFDYTSMWKIKSTLVRGKEGTFSDY